MSGRARTWRLVFQQAHPRGRRATRMHMATWPSRGDFCPTQTRPAKPATRGGALAPAPSMLASASQAAGRVGPPVPSPSYVAPTRGAPTRLCRPASQRRRLVEGRPAANRNIRKTARVGSSQPAGSCTWGWTGADRARRIQASPWPHNRKRTAWHIPQVCSQNMAPRKGSFIGQTRGRFGPKPPHRFGSMGSLFGSLWSEASSSLTGVGPTRNARRARLNRRRRTARSGCALGLGLGLWVWGRGPSIHGRSID